MRADIHCKNERVVLNQLYRVISVTAALPNYADFIAGSQYQWQFEMNALTDCLWYLVPQGLVRICFI